MNDGANNVNSVGAADTSITVGWLDDKIDRNDDSISSNSNYGPRTDDGDGDSWDEMTADRCSWFEHQFCSTCRVIRYNSWFGGEQRATIIQASGSSMSTPAVAGMVAIMLETGEMMPFVDEDEPGIEGTRAIEVSWLVGRNLGEWSTDGTFRKTAGTRDMDSE